MVGDVVSDRYELEEIVGSGGMSSVFRAHDRVLERKVALKILHQRLVADEEYVERFRREALMVAGLVHQNIVTVIDRGVDGDSPFIVFEFVAGENLKELVTRSGPLPIEWAVELGVQIARGLAFAHEHGCVHRDVKPQNVLLNGGGEVKVTDFGIARSLTLERGVTQTGAVLGTSDYIAPEQAQGKQVGEQSDMYSLGVVLYELLTGEVPFTGENFVAVAMQHINDEPPRVSSKRPDVPLRVDAAIARALAKRPEDRFPTMAAFGQELEACLGEPESAVEWPTMILPSAAPRTSPARKRSVRKHPPMSAILVVIGVALAAAALAIVLLHDNRSPGAAHGGSGAVTIRGAKTFSATGPEHGRDVSLATDGKPETYWETHIYQYPDGGLGKPGVGLVLDAGSTVTLRRVTITTDTPGFTAEIESGNSPDGPFTPVSDSQTVVSTTTYDVHGGEDRYFVVWITRVPPSGQAHVNEVTAS